MVSQDTDTSSNIKATLYQVTSKVFSWGILQQRQQLQQQPQQHSDTDQGQLLADAVQQDVDTLLKVADAVKQSAHI